VSFQTDIYFKINKSFDIFSSIFRIISENYVLDIDPQILIKSGIEGMLKSLDPYTEYYDSDDKEELEFLANASYTGLGISVSVIDSQLTITGIRDSFPAFKSGLKVGDRILKIDSIIVLNFSSEKLRDYTKGEAGSALEITVISERNDTSTHKLIRESIVLDNISYSGFISKNVGIIKLERFTRTSAYDMRKAIADLRRKDSLSALIIDLRDNPGGLLDAAVGICELFLPNHSLIVTTKAREGIITGEFSTISIPAEPDLPLCLLINENSASASEIVAGAIQDYDRGIILGKKSYGKGLVQSIFDLPFNGNIKITTSKYYTPSGRCIQKLDFAEKYHGKIVKNVNDNNYFRTKNGRIVYELNGIQPDSILNEENDVPIINDLIFRFIDFKFTKYYINKFTNIDPNNLNDDLIFTEFVKYLVDNDYTPKTQIFESLDSISRKLKNDNLSKKERDIVYEFENIINKRYLEDIKKYSYEITKILRIGIMSRYLKEREVLGKLYEIDSLTLISSHILKSSKYDHILRNQR